MKKLVGAAVLVLGAVVAALLMLRIWGVPVVSSATIVRSGATLVVAAGALAGLLVLWFAFFKNPAAGYDTRAGRRAQPKPGRPTGLPTEAEAHPDYPE